MVEAIRADQSVLVLGESGLNKLDFLNAVKLELPGFDQATVTYAGSLKKLMVGIAQQLGIETTEVKDNGSERKLNAEELKEAIADSVNPQTLLIFPESQRLPASVRYWLESLLDSGCKLLCTAIANPRKDLFLHLLEIELSPPSSEEIKAVMADEARKLGLKLTKSELSGLQSSVGRNPLLARKAVRARALGIEQKVEHSEYLDISPIIISSLMALGIVRFIGMGTGNKGLYIVGGVALILGMIFKQLGQVKGARKRLGQ